ncbi:MAG: Xaa-Pro peptidase family protein [Gemmatimonadales bacterium]
MTTAVETRRDRITKLRVELANHGLDAALLTHGPNVRYLSGFSGSSGMFVVLPEEAGLITDFRYAEQAGAEVDGVAEVLVAVDGLSSMLAERLRDRSQVRTVGFEAGYVSVRDRRELGERCGSVVWDDLPQTVERLRAVKDSAELASIDRAVQVAERALEETLTAVDEGMTELELATELRYRLALQGSTGEPFETIVASGERTALPHASPSGRCLREGDLLLLDFGATVDGYCSDITRTVVLGTPTARQREIHARVLEAQQAALAAIRPGCQAADVDRAARESLAAAELGDRFGHSIGHGIGLEVHEAPRLYRKSKDTLEAGNVVTVEPGVYLAGEGGVRVEENVVVVEAGHRVLTSSSTALREL